VVGLKGTGSGQLHDRGSVRSERNIRFTREVSAADRRETGPLYRFTTLSSLWQPALPPSGSAWARGALDAFIALAATQGAQDQDLRAARQCRDPVAGRAWRRPSLRPSRSYLLQTLHETWATAERDEALSLPQRAALKLAGYLRGASGERRRRHTRLSLAAGATAIFESNPFERRFRDVHTVIQQVQAQFANFEMVGQVLLGLPSPSKLDLKSRRPDVTARVGGRSRNDG